MIDVNYREKFDIGDLICLKKQIITTYGVVIGKSSFSYHVFWFSSSKIFKPVPSLGFSFKQYDRYCNKLA